ncbi:MAG: potassium/proton antiporter [Bacteroidales bacterium]|nr:potassium/proton antiporter [Bacteroidales bacterium]
MSVDLIAIILSLIVVAGILLYNFTKQIGLPAFIVFMGIGLVLGDGVWGEPVYDNPHLTEFLSSMALNMIIFAGGFSTSYQSIRSAWKEGILLSTAGVLITALALGYFTWWVTGLPLMTSILFGAIVSSTDAAVVFGILESKQIKLKHNTGTILEFESATNDPMALILVTIFVASAIGGSQDRSIMMNILTFAELLLIGAASGLVFGFLTKWILKKITFSDLGLVPLFILAMFFVASYSSNLFGGNLLIASYIFGVLAGNTEHAGKSNSDYFNNSLSWLAQALMFLFLGLQIFLKELKPVFFMSILPALFLIFFARPLAVFACYLPFRSVPWSKKLFISFIGLKGATPIVFAFVPLIQGVPHADTIFNMVFFIVIFSVLIQGTLLDSTARRLKLLNEAEETA